MNIAYYHLHLTDDPSVWTTIFIEQMKHLEESYLMFALQKLKIKAITQRDERILMLEQLCSSYSDMEIDIEYFQNPFANDHNMLNSRDTNLTCSETNTLKRMYDDAQTFNDKTNILYFHSKGSTSFAKNINYQNITRHKEYYYWRKFMNWGVIDNWRKNVDALKHYDTSGCDYLNSPAPHYSGNFWWAKASHIKKLSDPSTRQWWYDKQKEQIQLNDLYERMSDEMWVCSLPNTKSYDIVSLPESKQAFSSCLLNSEYVGYLK